MERLMPVLAPNPLAENLHETNARLGLLLDSLIGDGEQPRAATPQQMAGLLSELMRAGQWLRGLPPEKDSAVEAELSLYRSQVERLRVLLPSIHNALLRDRARLEQERARVDSAAAWARSSRQTL
jgi:hypothetical protein